MGRKGQDSRLELDFRPIDGEGPKLRKKWRLLKNISPIIDKRFCTFGYSETSIVGKLEQDVASFLGPLLDNGLITASAMCQYCLNLNYLNTIQLLVQINVHDPLIFSENPSPVNEESLILRKSVFKLARWIFPIVSATCKGDWGQQQQRQQPRRNR